MRCCRWRGSLHYRLYDIDRVINRTLVYGGATGLLGLAYTGSVVALEGLRSVTGPNDLAVVRVDLEMLTRDLHAVVRGTLQPTSVGVWIREPEGVGR